MNNLIHAAVVTLFAVSTAQAQQAVQWKVSDGGNGHWYEISPTPAYWHQMRDIAVSRGGHLATITSATENAVVFNSLPASYSPSAFFIGGSKDSSGTWSWVTGEQWNFTNWGPGEPNGVGAQITWIYGPIGYQPSKWNDHPESDYAFRGVIEYDADCNGDRIVDYGQCHDGTLPDYNGNNIPDCCEQGTPCAPGSYPVQWRVEDGGNGHWYQLHTSARQLTWFEAGDIAVSEGGYLATATSTSEARLIGELATLPAAWSNGGYIGPWLGGYQDHDAVDYAEPSGGWRWVTNEPWSFTAWDPIGNQPSNGPLPGEDFLHLSSYSRTWNDLRCCDGGVIASIIEWSADCNNDGIVDYGQILQGQLADMNQDGVPDICQQPTCRDADLFRDFNVNGADLGILLSQWGPNAQFTVSDINKDGFVNGADLGIMLSFWGACP